MRATWRHSVLRAHFEGGTDVVVLEGSARGEHTGLAWYDFPAYVTRFHFAAG
ncbi:MAG TPA: hypothetical protein VK923_09575 [Euzebyales bacterium]|nr:hypothetical protein [Euzebyales bacterium]